MRLAIITTHPIQYYAPVFRMLYERENVEIKVFYTLGEVTGGRYDAGFRQNIVWDIPLTTGYPFCWVKNIAPDPGSHHFTGIFNPSLITDINSYQPNVVLVYGWAYRSHLAAMRYFKSRIPVYFRGDSTLFDKGTGLKDKLKTVLLKWVYRHVDKALYPGTNSKAYFKKYGLRDEQLCFVPHAVDNDRFSANAQEKTNVLRESLKLGDQQLLILFAGKFEPKKDPILLLEAFKKLNNENAHLLFTGNGILSEELLQLSAGNERVHFMDFQNQSSMPGIYQACDIFVLPSKAPGETWGLAVNEAMAAGKPVIVSDKVGCAVDLVKPGINGEMFRAGDIEDLTEKLKSLLNKGKQQLNLLGENARRTIADWSIVKEVENIEDCINGNYTI